MNIGRELMFAIRQRAIGVIFPILQEHVLKLFSSGKDVFVKFTNLNLENNFVIVFYVSGEKQLIGEGKITNVTRLDPNLAWARYNGRIFLDEEEYFQYVDISPISKNKRKMTEITVMELRNIRRYRKPVDSIEPVTSSGRYLTKQMLNNIRLNIS
jgi:hypothetical protein